MKHTFNFKWSSLFIFMMAFTTLFAQNDTINRLDRNGKKQGAWKKYENNKLVYEGQFVNDVPIGEFKYYHENGKLKSISSFINGVSKVKTTIFHENEKKSAEGLFVDQVKDGEWRYYNNRELLIKVENYKVGKKEGAWKTYSSQDGVLLEEKNYFNDKLHGTYNVYFINGDMNTTVEYINGKLNGYAKSYYLGKILSAEGTYLDNLKTGNWNFYDIDGKKRKSIEYRNSRPLKIFLYFYTGTNGQPINQAMIAYVQKMGEKVQIVLKNGNKVQTTDSFETIREWLDILEFCAVTPSILVSIESIKGYKELEDDQILVLIEPDLGYEVISQGNEAKMVRSFFNRTIPKEEK